MPHLCSAPSPADRSTSHPHISHHHLLPPLICLLHIQQQDCHCVASSNASQCVLAICYPLLLLHAWHEFSTCQRRFSVSCAKTWLEEELHVSSKKEQLHDKRQKAIYLQDKRYHFFYLSYIVVFFFHLLHKLCFSQSVLHAHFASHIYVVVTVR